MTRPAGVPGWAFSVRGVPVPQGSMRAFVTRAGVPVIVHSRARALVEWRTAVAVAAEGALRGRTVAQGAAWGCALRFYLPRPRSAPKTRLWPTAARNDLDKLARAVLDALTGVAWEDDGAVVDMACTKTYVPPLDPLVGMEAELWTL